MTCFLLSLIYVRPVLLHATVEKINKIDPTHISMIALLSVQRNPPTAELSVV